jgi:phospholipid/cholesterol/gamma-HCH transport system substrate-binding protein
MDLHYKQEVTVGGLVLVAIGVFIAGTMWLGGKSFSTAPPVVIMFPDAGTLKRGSPVRVSGVSMGTVESIVLEDVGKVRVGLSLSKQIVPKADATARLSSIGLVGDVVVNLNPGSSAEPLGNRVIQGTVDQGFSEIGANLSEKASAVLTGLSQIEYKRLTDELTSTLTTFQALARTYTDTRSGPMGDLTRTMESFRTLTARFDSTLASANLARTAQSADSLMTSLARLSNDARSTSQQLDSLLAKVNRGEGSLGRLVSDTAFYDNAQRMVRSLQEFVDDLRRHPGKLGVTIRVF